MEQIRASLVDKGIRADVVAMLLDIGINGLQPEDLEGDQRAVGLRRALVDSFNEYCLSWLWTKEKICNTLFVALRAAYTILKRDGPRARDLFKALADIFRSDPNQQYFEQVLSETGAMLNGWETARGKDGDKWNTVWRCFTVLLEDAAGQISAHLPHPEEVLGNLIYTEDEEFGALSLEAQRLYLFLVKDSVAGNGRLETRLSPAFLNAQVPTLQVAINNFVGHRDMTTTCALLLEW